MTKPNYAPEMRLTAGDELLPAAMRASVSSVNLKSGLEGVDRLEVRLVNDNLRWLDHPLLAMGRELRLELGFAPNALEQMFVGDIVGLSPTFPADGIPTLTVVAHDRRERMQRGTKKRWFAVAIPCVGTYPIPDTLVTAAVATENHLLLAADPISLAISAALGGISYATQLTTAEGRQEMIRRQQGESDLAFVSRIAAENGWALSVDHAGAMGGNILRFTSLLSNVTPDLTLRYGESVLEFSARVTKVGEILAVTARFWIPQAKLELNVKVGWDWDQQALNVSVTPSSGMPIAGPQSDGDGKSAGPSVVLVDEEVNAGTVSRVILAKLLPKLNQRLTGTGSTWGNPSIKPGRVIRIDGLGKQFGGPYRVTDVTHTLDQSGFRTLFGVRKEVWFEGGDLLRGLDPRVAITQVDQLHQVAGGVG